MKLYIDTSDRDKIVLKLGDKEFESDSKVKSSQRLLPFIDEVLAREKKKLTDLTAIEVHTGPGSFTGLRIGVSVANALGWTLGIKVNGKNPEKAGIDIKYTVPIPSK